MASNMDTVGTFEMAKNLAKVIVRISLSFTFKRCIFQHGLFTTIHKYYSVEEWKKFADENPSCLPNIAASSGSGVDDYERLSDILHAIPEVTFICLDVANGYSQHFIDFVRKVRAGFPTHTIIVSYK